MTRISRFVDRLHRRTSSSEVHNPYRRSRPRENLNLYLRYLRRSNSGILFVGEAPGHKGCGRTGIPFTSAEVVARQEHPLFSYLRGHCRWSCEGEQTASDTWDVLVRFNPLPVLWNAFPFHPHEKGKRGSNQKPRIGEILEGKDYLEELVDIFKPTHLVAVGAIGTRAIELLLGAGETVESIRHPGHGGRRQFELDAVAILQGRGTV